MNAHMPDALAALPEPILVLGAYGYRNVGDEAILAGLLAALGPDRRVTVVSRLPNETSAMHGVAAVSTAAAPAALLRHRSLLVGGGGLFGSGMGRLGRLTAAAALAARTMGKSAAIVGVGVDPQLPRISSIPLRLLAPHLAAFTVRDLPSAAALAELGIRASLGEDLSALMHPAAAAAGRAILLDAGVDPQRPVVGLALTALGDPPVPEDDMVRTLRAVADRLPGVQLCCIPMSQHPFVPRDNDLPLARRLRERVPGLVVVEEIHHPAAVLSLVGCLSAMVAMRYHALRFAHRMATPVLAIPYAPKVRALALERGLPTTSMEATAVAMWLRGTLQEALPWTA